MKIHVIFIKKTRLANAPDEIFQLLKSYNQDRYQLTFYDYGKRGAVPLRNMWNAQDIFILHFHNHLTPFKYITTHNVIKIIHYHSEPFRVSLNPAFTCDKKLVLNQYHCTLPEYKNCQIIRNFFTNDHKNIIFNDKIKIGFYPSSITFDNKYADKGFRETQEIFTKLEKVYPDVIFEITTRMTYDECLKTKRDCHIVIDECKTGSFHKSTLEGLALGCIVIVNINPKILEIHKSMYNKTLPVVNSDIENLENSIIMLLSKGKEELEKQAIANKSFFDSYWNSEIVAKEYFNIYDDLLNNFEFYKSRTQRKMYCLIPARSGSKGILDKNIKEFNGKPLIAWSIEQALQNEHIKKTYVSTDSLQYADIARQFGANVIIRPSEISQDLSTDLECFQHFLKELDTENDECSEIIHLRPTYPNRSQELINSCIKKYNDHLYINPNIDSLRTVTPVEKSPVKMYTINDNKLTPYFETFSGIQEPYNKPRQLFPASYIHNGCIDIIKTSTIRKNSMSGTNICSFVMGDNLDIDDEKDFMAAMKSF